jgi:hypothetical protein
MIDLRFASTLLHFLRAMIRVFFEIS